MKIIILVVFMFGVITGALLRRVAEPAEAAEAGTGLTIKGSTTADFTTHGDSPGGVGITVPGYRATTTPGTVYGIGDSGITTTPGVGYGYGIHGTTIVPGTPTKPTIIEMPPGSYEYVSCYPDKGERKREVSYHHGCMWIR